MGSAQQMLVANRATASSNSGTITIGHTEYSPGNHIYGYNNQFYPTGSISVSGPTILVCHYDTLSAITILKYASSSDLNGGNTTLTLVINGVSAQFSAGSGGQYVILGDPWSLQANNGTTKSFSATTP